MITIIGAVGNRAKNGSWAKNLYNDVKNVQTLLNTNLPVMVPCLRLEVDGDCGSITIGGILQFQYRVMGMKKPDGRVDPGKGTLKALNAYSAKNKKPAPATYDHLLFQVQMFLKNHIPPGIKNEPYSLITERSKKLVEEDYNRAAKELGVDVALVKAVAQVEGQGRGFLKDGRVKILYERHWFSRLTESKYDKSHSNISDRTRPLAYGSNDLQYTKYEAAKALNAKAAMQSVSWGEFQIMGFNHKAAGYATVELFVNAMHESGGNQLMAFVKLLKAKEWDVPLRAKQWAGFAMLYNGSDYEKHDYDKKLQQAYTAFSAKGE